MTQAIQWAKLAGHGSLLLTSLAYSFDKCDFYTDLYASEKLLQQDYRQPIPRPEYTLFTKESIEIARYIIMIFEGFMSFIDGNYFIFARDASSLIMGAILSVIDLIL